MMSLSFMIRSSTPSILTSVPDHLPNSTRSPTVKINRDQLARLVAAAWAHRGDFALRGFFLGGVGNDDAASGLLVGVDTLDHDAVVERPEFHAILPGSSDCADWQSQLASASHSPHKLGTLRHKGHAADKSAIACIRQMCGQRTSRGKDFGRRQRVASAKRQSRATREDDAAMRASVARCFSTPKRLRREAHFVQCNIIVCI